MSLFSRGIGVRLKQKEERDRLAAQKSLQDHKVLDDGCGRLWERLCSLLGEMSTDINQEPDVSVRIGCERTSPFKVTLSRLDTGEILVGNLDVSARKMSFYGQNGLHYALGCNVVLTTNGLDVYLSPTGPRMPITPEKLAAELLEGLLKLTSPEGGGS